MKNYFNSAIRIAYHIANGTKINDEFSIYAKKDMWV